MGVGVVRFFFSSKVSPLYNTTAKPEPQAKLYELKIWSSKGSNPSSHTNSTHLNFLKLLFFYFVTRETINCSFCGLSVQSECVSQNKKGSVEGSQCPYSHTTYAMKLSREGRFPQPILYKMLTLCQHPSVGLQHIPGYSNGFLINFLTIDSFLPSSNPSA